MIVARIVHAEGYLPEKVLTNQELSAAVDTSDEWISTRTGIKSRHIASAEETSSSMAVQSCLRLMESTSTKPHEIDGIIVATTTPDMSFPSVACMVQGRVGASNAFAFDISAACSGFIYALSVADKIICTGGAKKVVVIGVDKMSSIVDWSDRSTCILFGDGAGAAMVQAETIEDQLKNLERQPRIVKCLLHSDGNVDMLHTSGGVSTTQTAGHIVMKGQEVFKNAIIKMSSSTKQLLKETGMEINDIDLFIPHQANKRIIDAMASHLGIDEEKVMVSLESQGNTSAASIPLAISLAIQQGKVKNGSNIVLQSIGAGLTWASCLIKW